MAGNGFSFTFNGTDLGESAYGLYADEVSAPILGTPRVDKQPLAGANGVVTQGGTFGEVTIKLMCKVVAPDTASVTTQLEAIKGVLEATAEGEKTLVLDQYPNRQYTARLTSGLGPDQALTGAMFPLTFLVPSGTWTPI